MYNSKVEPVTSQAIKLNLNGIKNLSKERILSELYKIFKLKNINILLKNEEIKNIFLLIFPEFKYLERLKKYIFLQDPELIFSILLVDEKDNYQYFCHKYNVSNKLKNYLSFIAKNYIQFKEEKNFLKKELKKNIYNYGKKNIKSLCRNKILYKNERQFTQ